MEISQLRKLFDYDDWANRESLASLGTVEGDAARCRRFLSHIIGAERIWLSRFETPDSPTTEAWPTLSLAEARGALEDLRSRWSKLLDSLTPEKLTADLVHRNIKGQEFRTPIRDALMHLLTHSTYHRGQVAAAVRDSGGKPAATDYIVYVRQLKK